MKGLKAGSSSAGGGGISDSGNGRFIVNTDNFTVGDIIRVRSTIDPTSYEDAEVETVGTPLVFDVPCRDYYKICKVEDDDGSEVETSPIYKTVDFGQTIYVPNLITYLFKDGDQCTNISGGWTKCQVARYTGNLAKVTISFDNGVITTNSTASDATSWGCRTTRKINVDNYNTVNFLYNNNKYQSIDISTISGSYYIYISGDYYSGEGGIYNYTVMGLNLSTDSVEQSSTVYVYGTTYARPTILQRCWLE